MEKGITNLVDVRQRNNEPILHYLQRFKEVRNQCYTLTLSEADVGVLTLGVTPTSEFVCVSSFPDSDAR